MTLRCLLPLALTLVAAAAHGGPASVARSVTNDIPSRPLVRLAVTAADGTLCHAYEEFLPTTVEATNITGGGLWLPDLHTVHWGPFTNTASVELTYRMVGPQGIYVPGGRLSADGKWAFTPTEIPVTVSAEGGLDIPVRPETVALPVITPPGSTSLPQAVTLSCATVGAVIRYTLDGTVPELTSTLYTGQVTVASATWIRARSFGSNSFPSAVRSEYFGQAVAVPTPQMGFKVLTNTPWLPEIQIAVTQAMSAVCWAYELWLPAGLTASNLTESGLFDSTNSLVRWGPLVGRTNAVLTCAVSGRAGTYSLRSRWSVDGRGGEVATINVSVTGGPDDVGIPERPPLVARPVLNPAGSGQLPVTVSVSSSTLGAELRYTTNGTAPTPQSALYTTALTFTTDTVLRVRGFKPGLEPSYFALGMYAQTSTIPALQVTRTISANATPSPSVELLVVPPAGRKCYAVTEAIPQGITPYAISHNGNWDETNRMVRWGPSLGADVLRLNYLLSGLPETYRLAGAGSVDGVSRVTTGPDTIEMAAQDALPDLVPAIASFERASAVIYSVTNRGQGVATAHWTDRWYDIFYLSTDTNLDSGDTVLGSFIGNDGLSLAAGTAYTMTNLLALPETSGGDYYLILKTDERGLVNEVNKANNLVVIPITVPTLDGSPDRVLELPAAWGAAASDLDFSPDGVRLAVAAGNRVGVWNLQSHSSASNALLGSFTGHVASVNTVNFSPANDEVLSGSSDGTIRVWDARTFAEARRMPTTNGEPSPAVFSPDGARVLGGAARGSARIWDPVTTNTLRTLAGHSASITAVAFSPDGTRALTGSSDKSAILWNAATGAILYRWTNHTHVVTAVAFSRDGSRALTASSDGTVYVWNPATGASVADLRQGRPVSGAVFSPDGLYVAAADRGLPGIACLWEVSSGRVLRTFWPFNVNPSTIEGIAFSPDRAAIATSHSDGRIRLWDSGLTATPINTAVPLPIATNVPVTLQSHGLYYFEIDVPANRSLVVTVDAVAAGGGASAKPELSTKDAPTVPALSADVRFANRARSQDTAKAGSMKKQGLDAFPLEADIEAFRVLATREHLPSVYEYDHFAQASVTNLHAEVPLSANTASKCYVLVFAPWLSAGTINAKIRASFADFHISHVSPVAAGNAGDATLKVEGLGFTPDTIPVLVASGHSVTGQVSLFRNSTLMHATFNLRGVAPAPYYLRVEKRGAVSATANDPLAVTAGHGPVLTSRIIAPEAVRPGRNYTLRLEYANTGDADMVAPLFVVSAAAGKNWIVARPYYSGIQAMRSHLAPNPDFPVGQLYGPVIVDPAPGYIEPAWPRVSVLQYLALNTDGPPGVLPPGAKFEVSIPFDGDGSVTLMEFKLEALRADATPIDWATLESKFRPPDMGDDLWAALWANFQWQIGGTWADYLRALSDQANQMAQSGGATYDVSTLAGALFSRASGSSYRRTLAANVDARAPAPALPLQFSRFCTDGMEHRFKVGPLGRGWSHNFEYKMEFMYNNSSAGLSWPPPAPDVIAIHTPGGGSRRFTRSSDGAWYGGAGESGVIERTWRCFDAWSFQLREKNGTTLEFDCGRNLAAIVEPSGNRITLTYSYSNSSPQLTTLTHSAGPAFQLQYNAQGRLTRLTDHAGQNTDYEYDVTGERLVRVTAPGGVVTAYAYESAIAGPAAHALASITFPDNTHRYFTRNAQGWVAEEFRDGGAERIQYAYDRTGIVTIRDAQNTVTTMRVGDSGQLLQMADPLGRPLTMLNDGDYNLTRLIGPAGDTTEMAYDSRGNTATIVNPAGQQVTMTHGNLSQLASLRDARDQLTGFSYDLGGNLTGITYPDLSAETFSYNTNGALTTFHNRRGQTIHYTRNAFGQITRKTYPDGRTIDYGYDSRGYLTNVVDTAGAPTFLSATTRLSYDSRSFMTNITYPDGKGFTFEYNAAGRRTRRVGHDDGYTLNYAYDAVGRLASLTEGATNQLVRYTYDPAGRLSREDKGNGTFTTYGYDPAGQVLGMTNHAPNGTEQSFFNYAYDSRGNRTSMTTADGVTAYQYDALSQLIGVTYPGGRNVTYAYDPAGNRTAVIDNGTNTLYTANSLNQYSQVGEANFTYDADGNMTSRTDPAGTTTYAYDPESRLIQVNTPTNGVWQYTYDALGNRTTVIHNGVTNRYLHDPIGLVDVAGEYDGAGGLVARYDHALGLVARTDGANNGAFYAFDVLGSTREVSGNDGAVENRYDYDVFGTTTVMSETMPNVFRFVGRFGVSQATASLYFMRHRHYDFSSGRFLTPDPIGFGGGDINLYRYVWNMPAVFVDPSGLRTEEHIENKVFGTATTYVGAADKFKQGYGMVNRAHWENTGDYMPLDVGFGDLANQLFGYKHIVTVGGGLGEPPRPSPYPKPGSSPTEWDNPPPLSPPSTPKPLPLPPVDPVGTNSVPVVFPRDPNDKIGPVGVGPDRLISAQDEMEYMIRFENHPTATAPVQELVVVDYLDPNLDWSTVELGEIRYGDRVIAVPAGQLSFSARDLPPTNSIAITGITLGRMAVDMTATFNPQNGRLEWRLLAKDTANNQFPYDALAGFLPPNNTNTHCGEGHLTFRVKPKLGLEIGTRIENKASIVFDLNDPIETLAVTNAIGQVEPKLAASISYPASEMRLGMPFNYSLNVTNSGFNAATNIVITNAIPAGFALVNATGTVGTVTFTNGNLVWTIGNLSNGIPATLTVTLLPNLVGNFVAPIRIRGGNGLVLDLDPLFTVQPPVVLGIRLNSGQAELFWSTNFNGLHLQRTSSLAASNRWTDLTNTPVMVGGEYRVTNGLPAGMQFYRLASANLSTPAPPVIGIQSMGSQIQLSWPTNATGFRLQSATAAGPSAVWGNVTSTTTTAAGFYQVTVNPSGSSHYFRLINP